MAKTASKNGRLLIPTVVAGAFSVSSVEDKLVLNERTSGTRDDGGWTSDADPQQSIWAHGGPTYLYYMRRL